MAKLFEFRARTRSLRLFKATALASAFIMLSPVMGLVTGEMLLASIDRPLNLASQAVVPHQTIIFKTL
jgi:hypothetical protein